MNKSAFTLLESLVSLVIIGLLLILTHPINFQEIRMDLAGRHVFDQITHELNLAKDLSMTRQVPVQVRFNRSTQTIRIGSEILKEEYCNLRLPNEWRLMSDFDFNYLPSGRINHFQSIRFVHEETGQVIYIVFQLGSGKFDVRMS